MKRKSITLQTKITIMVTLILFIIIVLLTTLMTEWAIYNVQKKVESNILNIARIVADIPEVSDAIEHKDSTKIQPYIKNLMKAAEGVEMIVIADMSGIRYAHPDPSKLGEHFVGGDDLRVLKYGETYISEAVGTLGKSLRAFTPIYNKDNKQVGFVMVGELTRSIYDAKKQALYTIFATSIVSLVLGILGAFFLARSIKRTLLGLEPEQITNLYTEKNAMLKAIHEGIIAIDSNFKVTLFNDSALKILNVDTEEANILGRDIRDIFPTSKLIQIIDTGIAEHDQEQIINGTVIVTNRVPIRNGEIIVGALATFRDKTIVTQLAEEITGVNQIIEALRANTHEFMNKLHVILGLIQIDELEEAKKYIINAAHNQEQILSTVIKKIKDPTIAGLILGKMSRAKELGIKMVIDEFTTLEKRTDNIKCDILITIIGNFIENALEAVNESGKNTREVNVRIQEFDERIEIEVKDSGLGIKDELIENIFKRGYTTKNGNRGIGLALVKETVDRFKGEIKVTSVQNEWTDVLAIIPKNFLDDNKINL